MRSLLLPPQAPLQAACGQHLPRLRGGGPQQQQHAEALLLRRDQSREVGQDRRVPGLSDIQRPK